MNKKHLDAIISGEIEKMDLTSNEKEIAQKILKDLEGTLVIRATSILQLCLKAIQYSTVTNQDNLKTDLELDGTKIGKATARYIDKNAKEIAQEVPVQEQKTLNQLRKENGLEPIINGDVRFISIKQFGNQ